MYLQRLDPLGSPVASTAVAALPVVTLLALLVWRRWTASAAGFAGAVVAVVVAVAVYGMPAKSAAMALVYGVQFGLLPIGWTVFGSMLLYNLSVETGQFDAIRQSIGNLSGDARVQAVLIGFAFGAFLEGSAGSGAPVAICGAMLVGFGVPAFRAAVICLIANTSPVCYGGLGTPVLTLASVTGIPADTISVMCAHQLPLLSCLIPLYMVRCLCGWRDTLEVWPVLVVGGGSFAGLQYLFGTFHVWVPGFAVWPLTDVAGGIGSLIILAAFLKFAWKPAREWSFARVGDAPPGAPMAARRVAWAWLPFGVMAVTLALSGVARQFEARAGGALRLGPLESVTEVPVPALDKLVLRPEPLRVIHNGERSADPERAVFRFPWLTAPGTAVVLAAIVTAALVRPPRAALRRTLSRTLRQMAVPIPTIACMIALSFVTKSSGVDATLGAAFAQTGALYPFFAAILGWLGVFLTGTDAGSNALFGSLQKITALQVHSAGAFAESGLTLGQAEVLICTANSTGGVMGKMIDAQSICVATAGTNQVGREADLFRAVVGHSALLACVVGLMTAIQAYVWPFTRMVPGY